MEYKYLTINQNKQVLTICLSRPAKLNAICFAMVEELHHALTNIDTKTVSVIFLSGTEKFFSAGGDLTEMKNLSESEAKNRSHFIHKTFQLLQTIEIPSVAFISGICLGGGLELALHCDIRIAAENTKLGLPELSYGIIPGAGGTVELPIQFGYHQAAYYLLTGENIPTAAALQHGLIQQIVPDGTIHGRIHAMESYFNKLNTEAIKAIKKMLQLNRTADKNTRYSTEVELFAKLLSKNGKQGIGAKF